MTEGTLVDWSVADGTPVQEGEVIYVIETDKVELEVESPAAGVIKMTGTPGETYEVGALIATIEA